MQVEAVDRDDRNTPHADLRFSLMEQTPRIPSSQMFFIDSITGEVSLTDEGESRLLLMLLLIRYISTSNKHLKTSPQVFTLEQLQYQF